MALIFVAGILARSWIGSVFISLSELIFDRLPFVTQIYSAAKQIGQAIDPSNEKAAFKECVLIKHPRHGEFALAFVTGECYLQVRDRTGQDRRETPSTRQTSLLQEAFSHHLSITGKEHNKPKSISLSLFLSFFLSFPSFAGRARQPKPGDCLRAHQSHLRG